MKPLSRDLAWLMLFAALASTVCLAALFCADLPDALTPGRDAMVIRDRAGLLLREPAAEDGLRADWTPLSEVPKPALDAIVQSEDHRLEAHWGVDPLGLLRALVLDVKHGRIVSGGSTLAMQLARLAYQLPRSWPGKVEQVLRGMVLQTRLGPRGVLESYVNLAPFGRDLRGLGMASRAYFDKPLRDLTTGESVALACLVRAPSAYDPHRFPARLLARRAHVLSLMHARGVLSETAMRDALAEPLHLAPFERMFRSPHASALARVEAERRGAVGVTQLWTTLDENLQRTAQRACKDTVEALKDSAATGCAAVILRASTSEVLAMVGSPDFRSVHAGQVNSALALRQPGSALKPFLYALAFEHGRAPGDTILDEKTEFPAAFGRWIPENYDRRYHGEVSLREALANSYNIPAAKLTLDLGVDAFVTRLRALGLSTLTESPEHYGAGLALGDGEVTLYDLTAAYAALARGGSYLQPTLLSRVLGPSGGVIELAPRAERRVFSEQISYLVSHVLQDRSARRAAFGEGSVLELPFDAAVKTGTSSRYRDNWTLGYAGDVVVGVWVGRHDGASMHGVSGVSGAGPTFRRLMLEAVGRSAGSFPAPPKGLYLARYGSRLDLAHAKP